MRHIRLKSPAPRDSKHPDEPYLDRLSDKLPRLVFIVGDHRSGTTLLYQSLISTGAFQFTSAYHIIAAAELLRNRIEGMEDATKERISEEFNRYVGKDRMIDGIPVSTETPDEYGIILDNSGFSNRITKHSLPAFRQLVQKLHFLAGDDRPILLKNPWDFENFLPVYRWFPDAVFVFVHRDPAAGISSRIRAMQMLLEQPNPYAIRISRRYADIVCHPLLCGLLRWLVRSNWCAQRMVQRSVRLTNYFFDHSAEIPASQQVNLSYEGLCTHPNETVASILQTAGVVPPSKPDFSGSIQPRQLKLDPKVVALQPLITSRLGRYHDYLRTLHARQELDVPNPYTSNELLTTGG